MKRPERDALSSHKRKKLLFPYVRYATVHPPSQFWHSGPRIKLEGDWLHEAGFQANWHIKITVHQEKLIIEPLIKPCESCAAAATYFRSRQFGLIVA